jgi:uncharacterized protein
MKDNKLNWWKFHSKTHKVITFIVTKDCQLACKYCYLVGKNQNGRMSIDTAKKAVDYILDNRNFFNEKNVFFEFIGGEPFLEIDMIDSLCDYIKTQMYLKKHPWFDNYMLEFTTNGINYDSEKVQNFIRKNKKHLEIAITIDGTKKKHDTNRIYKNTGRGSYDDVVRNIPLWVKQFPEEATKVTLSSEDLPYICESILHLFHLGIHKVFMNCVFEDVWKDGDDDIFEEQLVKLADAMIDDELYVDYSCSVFDERIGIPNVDNKNWCGSGKMLAIDSEGNFHPCNRFVDFSLREKKPRIIGNVDEGIDPNKVRPFVLLDRETQSPEKCLKCEISKGCAWCQGENYDSAETDTIYQRSTAVCMMHKARVRANNYYWNKLYMHIQESGKERNNIDNSKQISLC